MYKSQLVVVPHPDLPGEYRVVIGPRRRAACELAGLPAATCRIREDLPPAEQRQMMVRENVHRADLTAVEEADAYQAMLDIDGLTVDQVATAVSRSETTVRSRLRLARLPEQARTAIHEHTATLEDAAALADITDDVERERLAAALGGLNFPLALRKARDRQEERALAAPLLAALDAVGAVEHKRDAYGAPAGSVMVESFSPRYTATETAEALAAQVAPGWSFRWSYGSLYVYRPHTLEEAQEAADREAARTAADEARDAALAADAAARAVLTELAETTAALRAEFLGRLIHDRKALPASAPARIAALAADAVIYTPSSAPTDLDIGLGESDLVAWARVAVPEGWEAMQSWQRPSLLPELVEATRPLPGPQRLLLALAASIEPVPPRWWRAGPDSSGLMAWYGLLEDLGYPVSDAERALLTPPPADGEAE
ncbi:ParB/RepB/Spo0J family partition protein [Cellulomonas timonensis]|uniref:ParB/RepB/Spo0J family partition protein n=1 Tax=Cellulomonas timonensis TaxID=1689271 RepID=UPI000834E444|nr:ParB/RepB/Spo0J family partition protein [Cellulomonas timonensis]